MLSPKHFGVYFTFMFTPVSTETGNNIKGNWVCENCKTTHLEDVSTQTGVHLSSLVLLSVNISK